MSSDLFSSWPHFENDVFTPGVNDASLRSAFYPDVQAKHDPLSQLLQIVTHPEILFEFEKLVDLFVDYIIPTEAIVRGPDEPVLFNPARLAVFGAP